MLNIVIVGAGAIGSLVGSKLALANQRVTMVGRQGFVDAVRAQGLQLTDERGAQIVRKVRAVASLYDAYAHSETAFDLAILTVKSYDTEAVLAELQETLVATGAPAPATLSLQNGVGNEEAIAKTLTGTPVIAGSITTPVSVVEPGAIRVDKPRYGMGLGPWRPPEGSPGFDDVCTLFAYAGFAVRRYPNAVGMKWTKLLMNMLANASCAILDETPEQIFADKRLADLEITAWREALAVMDAARIPALNMNGYPFQALAPLIRHAPRFAIRPILKGQIGGARGGKMPSLHMDLHGGKSKNEVRWLNGAVARKGQEVGVSTPVNQVYTDTLLDLVAHAEQRSAWRGNHEQLLAAVAAARG